MHLQTRLWTHVGHMKDVRRKDGWTVHVRLGDAVAVTMGGWLTETVTLAVPEQPLPLFPVTV